ncbi:MAG: hypothetical protein K0Q43_3090, partial [Ramlibacter sp.]|nr:hypothetical protein [Ramlibacter sp.]
MKDQARRRAAPKPRHAQGIRHCAGLHVRPHAPAHHLAAEQVNDRRQVQPAFIGGDVGDVARPGLVRRRRREVARQQIRRNGQVVFAVGGHNKFPLASGLDAVALHQLSHALLADPNASCQQLLPHLRPAVFLLDLGVDGLDVHQQGFVADALVGSGATGLAGVLASPVLELAAGADSQHLASQRDRPAGLVLGNPGVLHRDSLAKYAVAFFK